jgi:Iap family predicted aminopeptidase
MVNDVDLHAVQRKALGELWASSMVWDHVSYLCDACGGRFAGTDDEQRAGDYLIRQLRAYGLENVEAEPFEMDGWVRGSACLVAMAGDRERDLPCLALPGSPAAEVEAPVVDVGSGTDAEFERLDGAGDRKVVLVDAVGPHRLEKYARACRAGAAAFAFCDTRSGMLMPTGVLSLGGSLAPIPGVGLARETASFLRRQMQTYGPDVRVRVRVDGGPRRAVARNVLAEIPGCDLEAGWIVACAHYDGHDVAQAAQDNATGTAILLEAARVLAPLRGDLAAGLRFALFSGEEFGLLGSMAYVRSRRKALDGIRCVLNADVVGLAAPLRLGVQRHPQLADRLRAIDMANLGVEIDDASLSAHSDHFPFVLAGVPAVTAHSSPPRLEWGAWSHTMADTLDKLDPHELRIAATGVAGVLLHLAVSPDGLPRTHATAAAVRNMLAEAGMEESLRLQGWWPSDP